MNKEFEARICRTFFGKQFRERLIYELSSERKRRDFFDKMSHTAGSYLGNCIYREFDRPPAADEVISFLGGKCYFITDDSNYDGVFADTHETLGILRSAGGVFIAVDENCSRAYLETELSGTLHKAYFLKA